jgi:RNA polymerase sigma-70 factor (ECF subfamily)
VFESLVSNFPKNSALNHASFNPANRISSLDLERIYDEHASALFAFLLNLTRNEADTRDIMQELFGKLAARADLLVGVRDERAFLLRLVHNQALDHLRRQTTRQKNYAQMAEDSADLFAAAPNPDEALLQRQIAMALGELPPEQRTVVHLKLWENQTFEAMAQTLGISPNTAASRYRYGIDKLRECLRPLYEEIK